jgi:hypothetical protein
MDPNADILDLAAEDHIERLERSHSGEYRRALNVSFAEDTSHDGLDSRLHPASDAHDEMEIVCGEDPQCASGTPDGDEFPASVSTSFDMTVESAHKDDESEGSPDQDSSEDDDDMDQRFLSVINSFLIF